MSSVEFNVADHVAVLQEDVAQAADAFLAIPPSGPEAMFDHLYAALPDALKEQREAALREGGL